MLTLSPNSWRSGGGVWANLMEGLLVATVAVSSHRSGASVRTCDDRHRPMLESRHEARWREQTDGHQQRKDSTPGQPGRCEGGLHAQRHRHAIAARPRKVRVSNACNVVGSGCWPGAARQPSETGSCTKTSQAKLSARIPATAPAPTSADGRCPRDAALPSVRAAVANSMRFPRPSGRA